MNSSMFHSAFLFLLLSTTSVLCNRAIPNKDYFKLCVDQWPKECQQISRDQEIECLNTASNVDCLLNADQGLQQFSVISPEEALLGAPLVSENVVVIGEVVSEYTPYQTAVIVRRTFLGGFENLRGLRYCHPGFKHTDRISNYVLEELESKLISLNCTNSSTTLVEKKIASLAEFFGSSCRPGKWTEDQELDAKLKSQYPSLCDNCGLQRCDVNYQIPFNDTLQYCLTSNGADVALTSVRDAEVFFSNDANIQNFQYLCSDGKLSDPSNPCPWTSQLKRVFITSQNTVEMAQNYIKSKLKSHLLAADNLTPFAADPDTVEASLKSILALGHNDKINITEPISLKTYVEGYRKIPSVNDSKLCNLTVNWATKSHQEQQKCKWLQQAAVNSGLQPVIECIQGEDGDTSTSLDNISNGMADIAFIDATYGYLALKNKLTNIAYPETDTRQLSKIVIVVKEGTAQNVSKITDLKSKGSCFPEYGGKEWLSFVDAIRTDQNDNGCDYGQIFRNFIGQSCVPLSNMDLYGTSITDDQLCGNCSPENNTLPARYCSADEGNKYYSSNGAVRCLLDGMGEYAVISVNDITLSDQELSQIRVLSRNGSLASYTGLQVDENAALTVITAGEVVISNKNTKFNDTVLLLRGIEVDFGQSLNKPFSVFESFNATKDLLFPDSTPGLTFGGTTIRYVDNFQKLIRTSEQCVMNQLNAGSIIGVPNFFVTLVISLIFAVSFF